MELEGLRGIAAVMVVIYHNLLAFYAIAFLGIGGSSIQHAVIEGSLYGNPIIGLFSGTFAVAIFFVLSGFVLSIAYFKGRKTETVSRMAIKRYPRLMLPALASTLLCLILIKLGLSHTQAAAGITGSVWLLSGWESVGGFLNALWSGLVGIFVSGESAYNNALWTMKIEFLGSFMVFAFLLLFSNSRHRWIIYILLLILTFNTWFVGFVIGMALADAYASGLLKQAKRNLVAVLLLLVLAIVLGGYPYLGSESAPYNIVTLLPFVGVNYLTLFTIIGAGITVFTVLWASQVANIMSKKYISILGKYTFSLYLVHLPILYTFTTGIFLVLHPHFGYNLAVLIAIGLSIPLIAFVTILFEKYIDVPSIKFGSKIADLYYGKPKTMGLKAFINKFRLFLVKR